MSNFYARSTDGSDSDNGTTWALAKANIAGGSGLISLMSGGDTGYVSQAHTGESYASSATITMPGSITSYTRLIAGNDGAAPPTADAGSKVPFSTTGASDLTLGGFGLIRGFSFTCGNANGLLASIYVCPGSSSRLRLESCDIIGNGTHTSSTVNIGAAGSSQDSEVDLVNTGLKFASGLAYGAFLAGTVRWNGGGFLSGTATPSSAIFVLGNGSRDGHLIAENLDWTSLSTSAVLFNISGANTSKALIRNTKFPASFTGAILYSAIGGIGMKVELRNCSTGTTIWRFWGEFYSGTIRDEPNATCSGADDAGSFTYKMTTLSNASELVPLELREIAFANASTGSAKTATVHFIHDSATALTDAEVWMEIHYSGTASTAYGSFGTCQRATPMATPANQATSTATFAGSVVSGMSNANKQKLAVTFTPQVAGDYIAKVFLAKASKTIYVDAVVAVS
jgi:hypothetical protein